MIIINKNLDGTGDTLLKCFSLGNLFQNRLELVSIISFRLSDLSINNLRVQSICSNEQLKPYPKSELMHFYLAMERKKLMDLDFDSNHQQVLNHYYFTVYLLFHISNHFFSLFQICLLYISDHNLSRYNNGLYISQLSSDSHRSLASYQFPPTVQLFSLISFVLLTLSYVILYHQSQIMHSSFYQLSSHVCRVFHRWGRVYFNQPDFEFFIDHEVEPENLETVTTILHVLQHTLERLQSYFFHLGLYNGLEDLLVEKLLQFSRESLFVHHVFFNPIVLMIDAFGDWVVSQVYLSVFQIFRSIGLSTKTNVSFLVQPNPQGLEVSPEHPLPYIELLFPDNQRPLNVLLNHPRNLAADNILQNLVEIVEGLYPSPSRHTRWLYNPNVITVQRPLQVYPFELLEYSTCFFQQLFFIYLTSFGSISPTGNKTPLINRYYQGLTFDDTIYFFLKGYQLSRQDLQYQLYNLNLLHIDYPLVLNKLPKNTFDFCYLEILIEILELSDVIDIIAPWKEYVRISSKQRQISNIPTKSKFSGDGFIFLKVIDILPIQQIDIVQIFLLTHKFQIVNLRTMVFYLMPTKLLNQALLKILVAQSNADFSSYIVLLLVVNDSLFAKCRIEIVFFFLLALLFIRFVLFVQVFVVLHEHFSLQQLSQPQKIDQFIGQIHFKYLSIGVLQNRIFQR